MRTALPFTPSPPPPSGTGAEEIKPPPPPSTSQEEAWENINRMRQESADRQEDRELEAEKAKKEKQAAELKKKNCAIARRNRETLDRAANSLVRTGDGEYQRLTEEERQAKIQEAEEQIKKYCE